MAVLIPLAPYWEMKIGALGEVVTGMDELAQAVRIVISTPKGSLAHRPDFGTDLVAMMDAPQGAATAEIVRQISQALADYEPRIRVSKVQVDAADLGHSIITVSWVPVGDDSVEPQRTSVAVATSTGAAADANAALLDLIGKPGGIAPLNALGQVPGVNLPSTLPSGPGGASPPPDGSIVADGGVLS